MKWQPFFSDSISKLIEWKWCWFQISAKFASEGSFDDNAII